MEYEIFPSDKLSCKTNSNRTAAGVFSAAEYCVYQSAISEQSTTLALILYAKATVLMTTPTVQMLVSFQCIFNFFHSTKLCYLFQTFSLMTTAARISRLRLYSQMLHGKPISWDLQFLYQTLAL